MGQQGYSPGAGLHKIESVLATGTKIVLAESDILLLILGMSSKHYQTVLLKWDLEQDI